MHPQEVQPALAEVPVQFVAPAVDARPVVPVVPAADAAAAQSEAPVVDVAAPPPVVPVAEEAVLQPAALAVVDEVAAAGDAVVTTAARHPDPIQGFARGLPGANLLL